MVRFILLSVLTGLQILLRYPRYATRAPTVRIPATAHREATTITMMVPASTQASTIEEYNACSLTASTRASMTFVDLSEKRLASNFSAQKTFTSRTPESISLATAAISPNNLRASRAFRFTLPLKKCTQSERARIVGRTNKVSLALMANRRTMEPMKIISWVASSCVMVDTNVSTFSTSPMMRASSSPLCLWSKKRTGSVSRCSYRSQRMV